MPERSRSVKSLTHLPDGDFARQFLNVLSDGSFRLTMEDENPFILEARQRCQREERPFSMDQYFSLTALSSETIINLMELRDNARVTAESEARCWEDEAALLEQVAFEKRNYFGGWWEDGALEEELARRQ